MQNRPSVASEAIAIQRRGELSPMVIAPFHFQNPLSNRIQPMNNYTLPQGKALVLRTCKADMSSYGGFMWPESGNVEAPDWQNDKNCGHGLHGWLWAVGDFKMKADGHDRKWLVVEVDSLTIVDLSGKVKFPKGNVILCTDRWHDAFALIQKHNAQAFKYEKVATGYSGHASATGDSGHASATGSYGHASATGKETIAAGLGKNSKVRAGEGGVIVASYRTRGGKLRVAVGYVGENGIKDGIWYRANSVGKFVKIKE